MSSTGQPKRVLVVGDVMTDIVVRLSGPIAPGADTPAQIDATPGGSGANQAAWLAWSGADVTFAARVGAGDVAAQSKALAAIGVNPVLVGDPERPTGRLIALVDAGGERSFLTDRGANENLCADDLPEALLDGVGLLHVSGNAFFAPSPRAGVLALMEAARRRAIAVSVDPCSTSFLKMVGVANFLQWTSGADLCFPNLAEAETLSGATDPDARLAALLAHYPLLIVKDGARGAHLFTDGGGKKISCAAPVVQVIDTTGAGDALLGGFLAAWLAGKGLEFCLLAAVKAGTLAVQQIGGRPPLATNKIMAPTR